MKLLQRKNLMKASIIVAIIAISTIATASLLTYYGTIEANVTVHQPILVDDHIYDEPIIEDIDLMAGESVDVFHVVKNLGNNSFGLQWHRNDGNTNEISISIFKEDTSTLPSTFVKMPFDTVFIIQPHQSINFKFTYTADPWTSPDIYTTIVTLI